MRTWGKMYVALGGLTGPAVAVAMWDRRRTQASMNGGHKCGNAMCNAVVPPVGRALKETDLTPSG